MATICSCTGKFVSLETGEPEIQNEDLNDGSVDVTVRLTRNCAECSEEKKETTFEFSMDESEKLDLHYAEVHAPDADPKQEPEWTLECEVSSTESGGGRYAKNMIGVDLSYNIYCDICPEGSDAVVTHTTHDEIQASGFDEI